MTGLLNLLGMSSPSNAGAQSQSERHLTQTEDGEGFAELFSQALAGSEEHRPTETETQDDDVETDGETTLFPAPDAPEEIMDPLFELPGIEIPVQFTPTGATVPAAEAAQPGHLPGAGPAMEEQGAFEADLAAAPGAPESTYEDAPDSVNFSAEIPDTASVQEQVDSEGAAPVTAVKVTPEASATPVVSVDPATAAATQNRPEEQITRGASGSSPTPLRPQEIRDTQEAHALAAEPSDDESGLRVLTPATAAESPGPTSTYTGSPAGTMAHQGPMPTSPAAVPGVSTMTPPSPSQPLSTQLAGPVHQLVTSGSEGTKTMTLRLSNEHLGAVTVKASFTGSGVKIELFAPQDAGREALRSMLGDLRRDLAGLGMNVGNSSLSVSTAEAPTNSSQHQGRHTETAPGDFEQTDQQHRRQRQELSDPETRTTPSTTTLPQTSWSSPVTAGAGLDLLA